MMPPRLALYKGKGNFANAVIRQWTRSEYSHCELVVAGQSYSSSMQDGGVRAKKIDFGNGNWDLIEIPWASNYRILDHFEATKWQTYGWWDLLNSQFLNRAYDAKRSAFCSEWCAAALGIPNPTLYSPGTLGSLIVHLNESS